MSKLRPMSFKIFAILLCFITMEVYGQKQSKAYKESFDVAADALLNLNTSHADIEFKTWSKNQVLVEATIEIEGATAEEAQTYFEQNGFEIVGNSTKVSVLTRSENSWLPLHGVVAAKNFHIEIPEFPEIEPFFFDLEELKEMPPIPINPGTEFDHKAFEKDGEKYLKEWQKKFFKENDKDYVERLKAWENQMKVRQEELHAKRVKHLEKKADAQAKRIKASHEQRRNSSEKRVWKTIGNDTTHIIIIDGDTIRSYNSSPSIFYGAANGKHTNYKVKKTIKVKMPKGMKIKMDVRHGEVKLAESTKNLNATLAYGSLWATTIDGDKTTIKVSYSPVNVENWNFGQLQAHYSEPVDLKRVLNLKLNATSSEVTIDNLVVSAFIKNDFGPLQINTVDRNFEEIDIALQNATLNCKTPKAPFKLYVNGTSSELTCPSDISLNKTKNHHNVINRGYFKHRNTDKTITINSKYSSVVFD